MVVWHNELCTFRKDLYVAISYESTARYCHQLDIRWFLPNTHHKHVLLCIYAPLHVPLSPLSLSLLFLPMDRSQTRGGAFVLAESILPAGD